MPRIEPDLIPVVTDLERGLRELGIPFGVIGALVPELLLDAPPPRMTKDADVTVAVEIVTREKGRLVVEDEYRTEIFELFRWYRLGTQL
jgi:hypothetical protein